MATWAQVKSVRLQVHDPANAVFLESVATKSALPAAPLHQAVYHVESDDTYWETTETSGADPTDYTAVDLRISDERIEALIDSYGVDAARCHVIRDIARSIADELRIVRITDGADSTEYADMRSAYKTYQDMADDCAEETKVNASNSSGRMYATTDPEIAGGNL